MATVTFQDKSISPQAQYCYNITGLTNGSNAISLPTPPASGSFPVAADWTPTVVLCFPYATAGIGSLVTPDLTTITNTNGLIAFTLYAGGNTNAFVVVF